MPPIASGQGRVAGLAGAGAGRSHPADAPLRRHGRRARRRAGRAGDPQHGHAASAAPRWCANAVADTLHYFAGAVEKHTGSTIPVAGGIDVTFHEPLGVVGLITPWNFPMLMASWKIGPALAAGNTAVLKPAEITPLTSMRIGELALEAGIPEGVLNVVVGPGSTVGLADGRAPRRAQGRRSPAPPRWASG